MYENAKDATKRLQDDKDRLTAMLGEMPHSDRPGGELANMPSGSSVDSMDLLPPIVKQKLSRLEVSTCLNSQYFCIDANKPNGFSFQLENQKLKEDLKAAVDANPSDEGARVLVEQLRKHEAELEENFLKKEQQMVEMQNSYEDKLRRLQAQVVARDEELRKKEIQYSKHFASKLLSW